MAKLTAPTLASGPRRELSDELHSLHRQAGWPSVRELARALGTGVASSSRIHDAFTKPRLPDWGLLDVLVAELARRAPDTDEAAEAKRFHSFWDSAAQAEHAQTSELEAPESLTSPSDGDRRPGPTLPRVTRQPVKRSKGDADDADSLVRERMRFSLEFATPREREQLRWAVKNLDGEFMRDLLLKILPRLKGTPVMALFSYSYRQVACSAE